MRKEEIEKKELLGQLTDLLNQEAHEKKVLLAQVVRILKKVSVKKEKEQLAFVRDHTARAVQSVSLGARLFLLFWTIMSLMILFGPAYYCASKGAYELAGEVAFYCYIPYLILMALVFGRYLGKIGRSKGWLLLLFLPWFALLFVLYLVFDSSASLVPQGVDLKATEAEKKVGESVEKTKSLDFSPDDRFRR